MAQNQAENRYYLVVVNANFCNATEPQKTVSPSSSGMVVEMKKFIFISLHLLIVIKVYHLISNTTIYHDAF